MAHDGKSSTELEPLEPSARRSAGRARRLLEMLDESERLFAETGRYCGVESSR